MNAARVPTFASMVVVEAPEQISVAPVQDALCALRLAVWTLERATARDGVDTHRVIDTLIRRAEELRSLLDRPLEERLERAISLAAAP